ncbi:MAG: sigma 54-interacting transcriptional regulator [Pseudobdellovibrionaceae bacterium]|jgi:DNA-binding NtrC family response regulator
MSGKAFLEIYGLETIKKSFDSAVTVGKDETCPIRINDPTVEDRHFRIEYKNDPMMGVQFVMKDLRSKSGSFINGTRISEGILADGDLIQVGESEMRFLQFENNSTPSFPMKSKNQQWNAQLQNLARYAQTEFPILLLGPSGTGKDVLAQNIHFHSPRAKNEFVSVNCSALTETLIESELFGHVKGSFTGAISDRKGAFEAARGGTLFLDEIGDLPISLQSKILRALENNEIRPVGSDRNITTNVRIIAATHQNLHEKIKLGQFRLDLYFRLNVLQSSPPALDQRMEDFDSLLYSFARQFRVNFSFGAMQRLKKHKWTGNIRELKNVVSRASALYPKEQINEEKVESLFDQVSVFDQNQRADGGSHLSVIKEIEKQMIVQRLSVNKGNQKLTAHDLGMPKSTLHDRLKYYQIDPKDYKEGINPDLILGKKD